MQLKNIQGLKNEKIVACFAAAYSGIVICY